jgi:adenosylcobinamide kinase/adenosylcobinamide-phosphate guanylyltransferase
MMGFVLGGARSGKSRYAQSIAQGLSSAPVYVATSRRYDDDHAARIARHQRDRGPEWTTIENDRHFALPELAGRVVVVDCITLWLTNTWLDAKQDTEHTLAALGAELEKAAAIDATWLLVSNELGLAPHASTEMGRKFVDLQGFANQAIARAAKAVTFMVAGLPMVVAGGPMGDALASARGARR